MTPTMWIVLFVVAVVVILVLRAKGETRMGDPDHWGYPMRATHGFEPIDSAPKATRERMIEALQSGNKLEAVRLYMEFSGSNVEEATKGVERLEKLVSMIGGTKAAQHNDDDADWDTIEEHLVAGNMIEAIQAYRETTGSDLKEAKEAVESYYEANKHHF